MEKLHFSIVINAPKAKVWSTMLDDATYRLWTNVFNPVEGSYYEGNWSTGSTMKFLGPEKDGSVSGMYSRVKENRPYEFLSLQHLGELIHGEEKPWPAESNMEFFENYTLTETGNGTEVQIDIDSNDTFKQMFENLWPQALEKLKELAEQ